MNATTPAHRAPIAALFAANTVSLTGSVLTTTGSPSKTGITAFFEFLASVLAAFFGGAFVDRIGFKRASVLADLTSGAAVLSTTSGQVVTQLQQHQVNSSCNGTEYPDWSTSGEQLSLITQCGADSITIWNTQQLAR